MRISLTGGAYSLPGYAPAAQRCVNLYPEALPRGQGETAAAVHVQTPGLQLLTLLAAGAPVRGAYSASNGDLYVVAGAVLYLLGTIFGKTSIATLTTAVGPVSMRDNTLTLVVVDGSPRGSDAASFAGGAQVNLATHVVSPMPIEANGFYGADWVDFLATFLVFNKPGTPQFYVSDSLATTFTPLNFANKTSSPDYLVAPVVARDLVWLVGRLTSEVWSLSGAADFPFQKMSGGLIEHGCMAVGSIAKVDGSIFLLSQDRAGRNVVMKTSGLQMGRISNHAVEAAIEQYAHPEAAMGYCYQKRGHAFYVLSFAEATWVYDESTEEWHQRSSDDGGRHRGACGVAHADQIVIGDYANGKLYAFNQDVHTDDGVPIRCIRSFPHLIEDADRIRVDRFIADVSSISAGPVQLRYSDDRGATFGNPVVQQIAAIGSARTTVTWWRLGMARDRVFELSWDASIGATLNGAFIEAHKAAT